MAKKKKAKGIIATVTEPIVAAGEYLMEATGMAKPAKKKKKAAKKAPAKAAAPKAAKKPAPKKAAKKKSAKKAKR